MIILHKKRDKNKWHENGVSFYFNNQPLFRLKYFLNITTKDIHKENHYGLAVGDIV